MAIEKLSDAKKKSLEEDFRNYKNLYNEAITAVINAQWKPSDLNDWIKGNGGGNQPQLNELIKKEGNPIYKNRIKKINAIEKTYKQLSPELQCIVDRYMWGEYSYVNWREIADIELCGKSKVYDWRTKIIETYAENLGEI
ncbi:transcriptional regulator [Enterococcus sp. DIV0800]|uniref:transcriptional regulator n=1 Tax=unclassified Enterococcus TaxID=2608891 RepID=UPI003D2FEE13